MAHVWSQLDIDQAHKSYLIVGLFSTIFCLVSLVMKEKFFIGEAVISTFFGAIFGPDVLNWVNPLKWGNSELITREISRVVLIIQIFAISVELPKKYMKLNYVSVTVLLVISMIMGWLVTGVFAYAIFPGFRFIDGLAVTAAITATDPVLAAAIIGKGKFGERVPAYLRHLISAESGANDGLAFPFVLLAVNLLVHGHDAAKITKDFILVAILYECVFGVILGILIGLCGRKAVQFCEERKYIDKESFVIFYIFLSLICTGVGSVLGADDLLVSFAAGGAFAWNGWFAQKTEGQYLSNAIDLLLNVGYFLYFGTIIPWSDFNNKEIGLDIWRLILFGIVIIFLRRIPAVLISKPFVPAITTWKEAVFVGHFGPIGVGGIFCSIITKDAIVKKAGLSTSEVGKDSPYYTVLTCIWPIICFTVITSVLVHGFSVTLMVLYSKTSLAKVVRMYDTQPMLSIANTDEVELEIVGPKKEVHAHSRKVLLGKVDRLRFYKIGHEVIVEDLRENLIKKYKIVKATDAENPETLKLLTATEYAAHYDDIELRAAVLNFLK